ncbi:MAG: hypothetical protein AB7Q42_21600 [Acidimicrobiia bacterium]
MRRPSFVSVACALGLAFAAGACDDGSLGTPDPTLPFNPQVEATDPPFSTVPAAGPTLEMIVDDIHTSVLQALGIVLTAADDECIRSGLLADVDPDALTRVGLDGIIGEQPIPVQTQIFGVYDRCVTPEHYAEVLGPVLVIAGADPDGATCFFESMRSTLGFAGMYRAAAGETGELDRDDTLLDAVGRIYDRCDVDPSVLAPPTTPPPPPTSAPPSTRPGPSTSAPPSTPPTTLPVLSTTTAQP